MLFRYRTRDENGQVIEGVIEARDKNEATKTLSEQLTVSYNTARKIISDFIELGFLFQDSKQKRDKLFRFNPYLEILEKEYE